VVRPAPDNLSPKHFDASVENARKIIDAVKPRRARFAYEMMGWAFPDSPGSCAKLVKAVDRPAFGVHVDACNLINSPEKFYHNAALLNECFDKLGPWIVSCHAKDLTWDVEMNVHFRKWLPAKAPWITPLTCGAWPNCRKTRPSCWSTFASAEEYAGAREHIFEVGRKAGLSFD